MKIENLKEMQIIISYFGQFNKKDILLIILDVALFLDDLRSLRKYKSIKWILKRMIFYTENFLKVFINIVIAYSPAGIVLFEKNIVFEVFANKYSHFKVQYIHIFLVRLRGYLEYAWMHFHYERQKRKMFDICALSNEILFQI